MTPPTRDHPVRTRHPEPVPAAIASLADAQPTVLHGKRHPA